MQDIVKDSTTLKEALLNRWDELGLSIKQVAKDAEKRGIKGVTNRSISVWKHNPRSKGALNQFQLILLAYLFGIKVRLVIGDPVINNLKLKYIIPQPFDEKKAITEFNELFPPEVIAEGFAKPEPKVKRKRKKKRNGKAKVD